MKPCYGFSASGNRVGSRHRWPLGWGKGCCVWCGRTIEACWEDDPPRDQSNPAPEAYEEGRDATE